MRATLDHIALESPDPEHLALFYQRSMGLDLEREGAEWRGEAPERRVLFVPGQAKCLAFAGYRLENVTALNDLRARIEAVGVPVEDSPSPYFDAAICVRDPDGNRFVFGLASTRTELEASGAEKPARARLQHVVMASRQPARIVAFFVDVLGFTLSDNVVDGDGAVRTSFLRCSDEHHNFAVFQASEDRLDHHCYEAGAWNAIRDWADHMAAERIPIEWGPGRHGPGNNLFVFIHDTDGNWLEISAELEAVAEDRPVGSWPHEERTLNSWGRGLLRS
jgi:catechol 2,3-dioxygenase-like lactoylglutathione lyase family enzyme